MGPPYNSLLRTKSKSPNVHRQAHCCHYCESQQNQIQKEEPNTWSEPWQRKPRALAYVFICVNALHRTVWTRPPPAVTDLLELNNWSAGSALLESLAGCLTACCLLSSLCLCKPVKRKLSSLLAGRLVSWLWYSIPSQGPTQETGCGSVFTFDTPYVTDSVVKHSFGKHTPVQYWVIFLQAQIGWKQTILLS